MVKVWQAPMECSRLNSPGKPYYWQVVPVKQVAGAGYVRYRMRAVWRYSDNLGGTAENNLRPYREEVFFKWNHGEENAKN